MAKKERLSRRLRLRPRSPMVPQFRQRRSQRRLTKPRRRRKPSRKIRRLQRQLQQPLPSKSLSSQSLKQLLQLLRRVPSLKSLPQHPRLSRKGRNRRHLKSPRVRKRPPRLPAPLKSRSPKQNGRRPKKAASCRKAAKFGVAVARLRKKKSGGPKDGPGVSR